MSCYRNLHRGCWSVKRAGAPVAHADCLLLTDVVFRVQPAGRTRVLRERRKCVHAFVTGVPAPAGTPAPRAGWVPFAYNPYASASFVRTDTGEPVFTAKLAELSFDARGKSRCRLIP